jgi:hypothetical protein
LKVQKPTDHDVDKLNREINQIMNQRLLVTAAAVSLFGVMTAQTAPNISGLSAPMLDRISIVSVAINFVILVLSMLHLLLHRYARILTSYLVTTESSVWEGHWKEFRKVHWIRYVGYGMPQFWIFTVLFVGTSAYPVLMAFLQPHGQSTDSVDWLTRAFPDRVAGTMCATNILLTLAFFISRFGARFVGGEDLYVELWGKVLASAKTEASGSRSDD